MSRLMPKNFLYIFYLIIFLFLFVFPISGCLNRSANEKIDMQQALIQDAKNNLQANIAEDFARLTIIKGSLGKFLVNENNPQLLGSAIGATESMIFPEKYELVRLTKIINISAEIKKEIISQPMLDIIYKNREVMNHIYNSVLLPLSLQIEKEKTATTDQLIVIDQVIRLLDKITIEYRNLSRSGIDYNGDEAQANFITLQNLNRELQKLKLPEAKQ